MPFFKHSNVATKITLAQLAFITFDPVSIGIGV